MSNKTFIPKGINIITKNGCKCKNEFRDNINNIVKNSCTQNTDIYPWCEVKDECGIKTNYGNKTKWIDYCQYNRTLVNYENKHLKYGKHFIKINLIGIFIFIVVFVLLIPYLLYYFNYTNILEFYLPNFDLIATTISFAGGPGKYKIFQELYNKSSNLSIGIFSLSFINYISLIGVSYLIITHTKKSNSYTTGICISLSMLLITYLLPNQIISTIQNKIAKITKFNWKKKLSNYPYMLYLFIILIGCMLSILFILFERLLIKNHNLILHSIIKLVHLDKIL